MPHLRRFGVSCLGQGVGSRASGKGFSVYHLGLGYRSFLRLPSTTTWTPLTDSLSLTH